MRGVAGGCALFAALVLTSGLARADGGTPTYSYAIANLDAYPEQVFVAWPRTCGSTGDPLGAVSLQLNPDWAARQHEVDYEVLEQGKRYEVSPFCVTTMRIHALSAAAFPRASRDATTDDLAIGKKAGDPYPVLPALDAIELTKRIPFFASDPRQVTFPFRFDTEKVTNEDLTAAAAHFDLVLEGGPAPGGLTLRPKHAKLAFDPPDAAADAGPTAAPAPEPTPARQPDRGTRWVYAAAIGGLLAGGIIAQYRKKKPPAAP